LGYKSIDFVAKIRSYNVEKYLITLEFSLNSEDAFFAMLELLEDGDFHTFKSTSRKRKVKPITDAQLKFWFVCLNKILTWKEIYPDQYHIRTLHEALKVKYFPVDFIDVGSVTIPGKKSITDMTKEETMNALDRLITDYEKMGVKGLS
jgi:hypothetical protein